ncbi:MAG: hypothetical protein IH991_21710, partial [Planctomycetes bacterium]|nr:hypothetical protein [Planctomycetota bacterium]
LLHRTKSVIISSAVALQEYVKLFKSVVGEENRTTVELSMFNCAACHHDLKAAGARGTRSFGSAKVGRPPLHLWPATLVKIAIRKEAVDRGADVDAEIKAFNDDYNELREAVAEQMFGNPAKVGSASEKVIARLEKVLNGLENSHFDKTAADDALSALYAIQSDDYLDFHSARQIAWAIKTIRRELNTPYPVGFDEQDDNEILNIDKRKARGKRDELIYQIWSGHEFTDEETQMHKEAIEELKAKVPQLFSNRSDAVKKDEDLESVFKKLNAELFLILPAGQEYKIPESLPKTLDAAAKYHPDTFGEALKQLKGE